jgi:glycosyltransferase involved in cell wall biosynthesis
MKKLRILQVNKLYYPWIGGVEKVVQDIAEALRDRVDMEVLVCQPQGRGSCDVVNGVRIYRAGSVGVYLSSPVSFSFPFYLRKLSRGKDIVHFHMPFPLGDISQLLVRPDVKVVAWWHSDIVRQKFLKPLYEPFLKRFLHVADKIIVASPSHIDNSPYLKRHKDKCAVIPFGIDTGRFRLTGTIQKRVDDIRSKYGTRIVLSIGRLVYYKGLEHLINAMKNIDACLLIVGDGYLKNDLEKMVCDLKIGRKIKFLGTIDNDEVAACYHACDIFVLPSIAESEAFGIVQLEAMACGKPVINTSLPTGVPWVSVHRETGITVPPGDSEALADAIHELFDNAALRERYGRNASVRVLNSFALDGMIEKIYQIYEEVAA